MNLSNHPHHRADAWYAGPSFEFPRVHTHKNLSLSTKLVLLVVIPLALTMAVTLPLTVTGLDKLASVTSAERLEDQILLVEKHLRLFQADIERAASEMARDPALLAAVQESNNQEIDSILLGSRALLRMQHLEVVDGDGSMLGHVHHAGDHAGEQAGLHLPALTGAKVGPTKREETSYGWFLL